MLMADVIMVCWLLVDCGREKVGSSGIVQLYEVKVICCSLFFCWAHLSLSN